MSSLFRKLGLAALAAAMLFAVSCTGEQKVVIVSTNDMHGAIDNFPALAALVEQIRADNCDCRVLLVDAGDRWTGNPFVDLAEKPLYPIVELMNKLGYDVATLGNHEFDWGPELLDRRTREMDFPVICANIDTGTSPLTQPRPYEIIEIDGMRIAFLGLITNFIDDHPDGKAENFAGITFPNVFETAESYRWLAAENDVFVGLTHIGDDADEALAARVPELDLIIGGHTHTVIDTPRVVGKTVITQAGSKLRYAGVTTLSKRGKKLTIENHLVALDTIAGSPRFQRIVDRINNNPALYAAIGETAGEFDKQGVNNLVTDAIRWRTKTDIALYHRGGIRVEGLPEHIGIADLYRIEPFMSEIYTLRMTPGQIKGLIIAKFNDTGNPKESHKADIFPSGLTYRIITDEAGEAIDVKFGVPERAAYTVAMPDYMYKIYRFDRQSDAVETGLQVTAILKEYIESHSPLLPDNAPRIEIE